MVQHDLKDSGLTESTSDNFYCHDSSPAKVSGQSKKYRLFGREKHLHNVLGGGKLANILLWRDKKISAGVIGCATAVYVLFGLLEYPLLTLLCHCAMLSLAMLFVWSNACALINRSPPQIPEVCIPQDQVLQLAANLRFEINKGFAALQDIATGKDPKKFLGVVAGLWILSIMGSWCNFLTLFYIAFIMLHTVPVLYEKYEDEVDGFAEKAMHEIKKQYAIFDAKILSQIPKGQLKEKKEA